MSLDGVVGMSDRRNGHRDGDSPLDEYMKKRRVVKKLADTIELHHEKAYTTAAEQHLKGKDDLIDYERLRESDVQQKMADTMADFYVERAKDYLHLGDEDLDDVKKDMIMSAYAGITRGELRDEVRNRAEGFTLEQFRGISRQLKGRVEQRLAPTASAHIKRENLEDILKGMKLDDKLDPSKLDVPEVTQLLEVYHANDGTVPERAYRSSIAYKGAHDKEPAHAGHR